MILVWRPDTTSAEAFTYSECANHLQLCDQGLKLDMCVPFPQDMDTPDIVAEGHGDPTDFFMSNGLVVSDRLRQLFETMGVRAEYAKVDLEHNGAAFTKSPYFLVNLLESVNCVDYERSRFTSSPTGIGDFANLVIDEAIAAGHSLFMLGPRPCADPPNPLAVFEVVRCASEELAVECMKQRITGVAFTLPNDRNVYPPPLWTGSSGAAV